MKKTRVLHLSVFIIVVLLVTCFFYPFPKQNTKGVFFDNNIKKFIINPETDNSVDVSISFPSEYLIDQITFVEESILPEDEDGFVDEKTIGMQIEIPGDDAEIDSKITIRSFSNGDVFLFLRYFCIEDVARPLQFKLEMRPIISKNAEVWSLKYHTGEKPTESETPDSDFIHYKLLPQDNILPPSLFYLEMEDEEINYGSILAGAGSIFENAPTELSNLTTLKRIDSQPVVSWLPSEKLTIQYSVQLESYQTSENWFFISNGKLLNMFNSETYKNMKAADLNKKKIIRPDGIFHIANENQYVGASSERYDYYYNYAGWEGIRFMELYKKYPKQRFFFDMFINTAYTTAKAASKYGNWTSSHRSSYLWEKYQIPKNYIDTRYCTDAGVFLLRAYNDYQIPEALYVGKKFGNYLVDLAEHGHKIKTENGFFYYDYYHPDFPNKVTHSSLNHILSEMNYLLELYLCTHDEKYLSTAEGMVAAIEDTEDKWIRNDIGNYRFYHDLWYGAVPRSDGTLNFEKYHDYTKDLTYKDLLKAQSLLSRIFNRKNVSIANLIRNKEEYLIREGYDVQKIKDEFN
ncbi:MAG: hypothetical protein KAH01_01900 [Caldisericia bacterium]|nr:hypothetical protein [Caldisericia bacterium]